MRANPFESQLKRLARTLTEQFGVNVICQGDNAWTDGRQIVLPSLPEPMDEALERMMVGYLDHEMAHVAFSDVRAGEDGCRQTGTFAHLHGRRIRARLPRTRVVEGPVLPTRRVATFPDLPRRRPGRGG